LPRLFVYHTLTEDSAGRERFKVMEHKLFYSIMNPAAIATSFFGFMVMSYDMKGYMHMGWFHAKLSLIVLLICYHIYCGYLVAVFKRDKNSKSHVFYRIFNEIPVIFLVGIVILAIVKPF